MCIRDRFKIISLVREPIGRNMSEFFHRFKMYTGTPFENHNYSLDDIRGLYLERLDHDFPLEWFDNNFKKHFGVDVYEKLFPKKGYEYYGNSDIDILLMKHNLEDSLKERLIN